MAYVAPPKQPKKSRRVSEKRDSALPHQPQWPSMDERGAISAGLATRPGAWSGLRRRDAYDRRWPEAHAARWCAGCGRVASACWSGSLRACRHLGNAYHRGRAESVPLSIRYGGGVGVCRIDCLGARRGSDRSLARHGCLLRSKAVPLSVCVQSTRYRRSACLGIRVSGRRRVRWIISCTISVPIPIPVAIPVPVAIVRAVRVAPIGRVTGIVRVVRVVCIVRIEGVSVKWEKPEVKEKNVPVIEAMSISPATVTAPAIATTAIKSSTVTTVAIATTAKKPSAEASV